MAASIYCQTYLCSVVCTLQTGTTGRQSLSLMGSIFLLETEVSCVLLPRALGKRKGKGDEGKKWIGKESDGKNLHWGKTQGEIKTRSDVGTIYLFLFSILNIFSSCL